MDKVIPIFIEELNKTIEIDIEVTSGGGGDRLPDYKGSYSVTPKTTEIVLPTKNKSMRDDVTVFQVPYAEVPNTDGTTVIIGIE